MVKPLRKRKAVKKFNYDRDRKKEWKQLKALPEIKCKQIKEAWNPKQSVTSNLREMGLSSNPNKTFPIPTTKSTLGPDEERDKIPEKRVGKKLHVAEALEKEANKKFASNLGVPENERLFCVYMLDKYGDDYKAMSRDYKNYYQETPKQIKRKIELFKRTKHQYKAYLEGKKSAAGEGT